MNEAENAPAAQQAHSREWYARLARELGGYRHPWRHEPDGPPPEGVFDALLEDSLGLDVRVLEAGCGHGPDAARHAGRVAVWTAYDQVPELLDLARSHAPDAHFVLWDGRGEVPGTLLGPHDLIVCRRGPTSVIRHLPVLGAPDARFLYVGPRLEVPLVTERLNETGWRVLGEWRTRSLVWLPTEDDVRLRCEFMGERHDPERWARESTPRGLPVYEERYTVLAGAKA